MITIGLVKELHFIAATFNHGIHSIIRATQFVNHDIHIKVSPDGKLEVEYFDFKIWQETIDGPTSMFGVESCDTIFKIINCIDNGVDWSVHKWKENIDIPVSSS